MLSYRDFFKQFNGHEPFHFQTAFHENRANFKILNVPTGLGKTQTVLADWLYSRPTRRLIYCLPGRTLTRQVSGIAKAMVDISKLGDQIQVLELMGGGSDLDLTLSPADYAIIVGTQDILVSRALNRGYASTAFRWPIDFALFNNDAMWVLDEVQLLGDALATTAQLAGFRQKLGTFGQTPSVWMSATFDHSWLTTADFQDTRPVAISLTGADRSIVEVSKRINAVKTIQSSLECDTPKGCASFAKERHKPGTLSLIVANTVARAQEIWEELHKLGVKDARLLHSRFRACDRIHAIDDLLSTKDAIVVSTQVIEAGVDIDAELMITDIAPWPSLVQRFGRVNRRGDKAESTIFWVAKPSYGKKPLTNEALARPYSEHQIEAARKTLQTLTSASPSALPMVYGDPPYEFVLRKSDLLDLFDTTPDLAGNHIDISRFVRAGDERNIYMAWRDWNNQDGQGPSKDMPRIQKRELCPVPISDDLKKFVKEAEVWFWDFTASGAWKRLQVAMLCPGMQIVCHLNIGGYDVQTGWSPSIRKPVPAANSETATPEAALDDNQLSFGPKQTLEVHTNQVVSELKELLGNLAPLLESSNIEHLQTAARYHDWGKAHPVFQRTMHGSEEAFHPLLAKSESNRKHSIPWFRHELASSLAMISRGMHPLAAYIVAAHHGKVRLNLRSMPGEKPDGKRRIVRGVKDGDQLPTAPLGAGIIEPPVTLDLTVTEIGLSPEGRQSWTDRIFEILEGQHMGPFRLSYLEMLLRCADQQASEKAAER